MNDFLGGAAAAAAWIVAMFLFKFWRESRDRLLLLFSLAFIVLGLNWALVSAFQPGGETRHLCIEIGHVDKTGKARTILCRKRHQTVKGQITEIIASAVGGRYG